MFDFVVVGAGSAGCVLANRLSEDPKRTVALIEAGPRKHGTLKVRAPFMYQTLWRSPLDWAFSTAPQPHSADRRHFWPRGRIVGGTSCLNAMVYMRGHRDNYDEWRDLGNPGWGWTDVLPYFKRSEDNARGASEHHGAGGPLAVGDHPVSAVARAFVEATAARCKVPVTDDFNAGDNEGAGAFQSTVRAGLRASTAAAFLDTIRDRKNLTVLADATATGLVVAGTRVTGVRCGNTVIEGREIILAAGAIGSPQLLLLSGIGPAAELPAGITPTHELPEVGKHLADHLLVAAMYEVTDASAARRFSIPGLLAWIARHLVSTSGPLGVTPVEAGAFVRSRPDAPRADNQFHFTPWGVVVPTDQPTPLPYGRLASILPGLIYPRSLGEIRLASADPLAAPIIDPRYLSEAADLEHLVTGLKLAREIAATAPLAGLLGDERLPGKAVATDDALRDYIRATCNTIFHPVGTCRMGSVVDAELRVKGLTNLRVADASIMPRIIGGNTNAPVIMIAEKASSMLLATGAA